MTQPFAALISTECDLTMQAVRSNRAEILDLQLCALNEVVMMFLGWYRWPSCS